MPARRGVHLCPQPVHAKAFQQTASLAHGIGNLNLIG
jgi:hypothetical protein